MKRFTIQIFDNEKNAVVVKADTDCIIGSYSVENDPEKKRTETSVIVLSECCLPELAAVIESTEKAAREAKKNVVHEAAPKMLEKILKDLFN